MLGSIAGDIIGSVHEGAGTKRKDFPLWPEGARFTDDTVLTIAVAEWLLEGGDLATGFHDYVAAYPSAGYGGTFLAWALQRQREPYGSWGNGAAMRVSPVGFAAASIDEVLVLAEQSAVVSHNHPEGIRGAQAVATAVYLARNGGSKDDIRHRISQLFGYRLDKTLDDIRPHYSFDVSCQGSVPESLIAFLESTDYEDAVRNAISLGGDADTMACIAGGIAEAFYGGVPAPISEKVASYLDERLRQVVETFSERYGG
jgi:ADP-ribosylglycohydrolase